MNAAVAVFMVFVGCCSNVVFLELLVKEDPSSGNIITFSQFFVIALEGFVFTSKFGTQKPTIRIRLKSELKESLSIVITTAIKTTELVKLFCSLDYAILVAMFFSANVCNNYAFNFNIPMPLHMIFRAGSLIANMVMGILILKKRYTIPKYVSVLMITLGISICTIVSGKEVKATAPVSEDVPEQSELEVFLWWTVGITLLTIALFVSARMGIYQEVLYGKYGKHPRESLFYTHMLPLPGFLILYDNIYKHLMSFARSSSMVVLGMNTGIPKMYVYLAGNVLTQCLCINSVYVLTSECTSLTVTLVVTLRKFVSLLFSILCFKNDFTIYHWIGTILVFGGTLIFTEVIDKAKAVLSKEKKVK